LVSIDAVMTAPTPWSSSGTTSPRRLLRTSPAPSVRRGGTTRSPTL